MQHTYRESELADLSVLRDSWGSVGCEDNSNRAHKGGDGGANHDYSWRVNEEFGIVGWVAGSKETSFAAAWCWEYIILARPEYGTWLTASLKFMSSAILPGRLHRHGGVGLVN
jgi:hypothetical protein